MYDVVIIGAGVASLLSSIYLRRAGKSVLILEKESIGGQIINTLDIENFPGFNHISGYDLIEKISEQARNCGALIKYEKVINIKSGKIKKIITTNNTYQALAVIIATGCSNRKLGLTNEDNLIGRGISFCATCDGAFYKNKDVLVVGGGNTAMEDALYLSNIARKVTVVHRRDTFKSFEETLELLKKKDNVHFIYNSNVTKINGKEHLESVEVTNNNGSKEIIKVDGMFIAIGKIPANDCFKDLIKLDENGYVISKENCHTNRRGIFVAGDIRKKDVRQLVTATSDGAVSAIETVKYLDSLTR